MDAMTAKISFAIVIASGMTVGFIAARYYAYNHPWAKKAQESREERPAEANGE